MKTNNVSETDMNTNPDRSSLSAVRSPGRKWPILQSAFAGMMCLVTAIVSTGCGGMSSSPPVPSEAYRSKPSSTLSAGDEIRVTFSGAPELNVKQKIQANGKVSLPTIGDVNAAGRTITSFQAELTSLYAPHLQDPTVIVSLESAAAAVYLSGEVLRPGKIPLDRPMTALEAVMEAGGFTRFANQKQVIVVRTQNGKNQRYVLNLKDALYGTDSSPFYMRTYDVIYVRQSAW
ncbi:MAG: polysaccharide biosynthesis/export family protein [Armatimonadetes bacterium]|nr:polysaccharide biosynthesis/export family protein [Akkermansiaceae bacterium]